MSESLFGTVFGGVSVLGWVSVTFLAQSVDVGARFLKVNIHGV